MTVLPSITPGADGSVPMAVVSAALAEMESRLDEERSARRTAQERAARQKAEAVRLASETARQEAEADRLVSRAARLEAENADLSEQIRRLEHLNDEFRKLLFGKKSEKLPPDDRQLSFEDLGIAAAEADVEPPADDGEDEGSTLRRQRKRSARSGFRFPEHVERRTEVIEPESTLCPCGCGEMARIGEDRSERLDFVPAKCVVVETVRPRYACNRCKGGGVVQAPAPPALIEGGLPTEALLAHVIVSKYADHLPLYRQAQMFARQGIELHRATLADWVGKASFHLRPLVDCLAAELRTSGKLGMDETPIPVLDPGRGKTKQGFMWTMVRDERPWSGSDPPGVVYAYAPGRGGRYGEALLEGFSGTLQVDGYAAYNRLRRHDRPGGAVTLANCWVHARRGLKEVHDSSGSPIAREGLARIAQLYAIEDRIRGEHPATRQFVRWTESAPLVNAFGVWLDEQRSRVSPRSRLGEKLAYIANQWDGLLVFLHDGRVEMDTNFVENRIRPLKLTKKNALFAGHDEGAVSWARVATLIETCKMNGVEPYAWLRNALERIAAGHPMSRIHELLPWNFGDGTDAGNH